MSGRAVTIDPELERRWRRAEDAFFAQAWVETSLYETSVELVRGLADGLRDVSSENDLAVAYAERGTAWVEGRLVELELPRGAWLDIGAARDAAFNLRLKELRGEVIRETTAERFAAARAAGQAWLVALDGEVTFAGQRTYRRVELHTRAGVALYGYSAVDWERGETCWLEVLPVDPQSGAPIRGARPLVRPRAYADRAALVRAFARARRRWGGRG